MSAFTDRLVHAAAMQLIEHTPSDAHADPAAREAVAAVLDVLVADLDAWKARIDKGQADVKSKAAQKIGLSLVAYKLVDAADEIRHPRPAPREGGKP